jgi:hypothetical protein
MTEPTTTSAADTPTPATCSKCDGALDTEGYPKWCKACRAKHRREYESTRKEMSESRGYAAGVSAMRLHLAGHFERLGAGSFAGYEIAALIRQARGPADV